MAAEVGEAVVKLSFDASGVDKGLDEAEKKTSNFGDKVGKVAKGMGVALAGAFTTATAAVVSWSKKSLEAFNEQEKAFAKLSQVAENQNWSAEAVGDLAIYNSELQKTGIIGDEVFVAGQAQLGTFALSSEAVKKLTPALGDLIAATSGYEATTESATSMANLLGKVMTGSVSALTRYGVTLDDNQKKLIEEGDEMTRAATLVEVLSNNYGGFNEALAETPQGKVKQLSNAFGDLKENFGAMLTGKGDVQDFMGTLEEVFQRVIDVAGEFIPHVLETLQTLLPELVARIPDFVNQLMPIISGLIESIIQILPQLLQNTVPQLFTVILNAVITLIGYLPQIVQSLISMITTIVQEIIKKLPEILKTIVNAIMGIVEIITQPENLTMIMEAGIELLLALVDAIPDVIVAIIEALPKIIENIIKFLTDPSTIGKIIEAAVKLFLGIVQAVPRILGSLIGAFGELVGKVWDFITQRFGEFAAGFGNFLQGIFKGAVNAVLGFIEMVINAPFAIINGFIGVINFAFGWLGVHLNEVQGPKLPRLAEGGLATSATTAIIGEEGREAVIPLEKNQDNWAGLLASTLAEEMQAQEIVTNNSPITVYMTNEINNKMDAEETGRLLEQSIRRYA